MIDVKVFLDTLGGHEMTNFFGVLEVKIKKRLKKRSWQAHFKSYPEQRSSNERLSMI